MPKLPSSKPVKKPQAKMASDKPAVKTSVKKIAIKKTPAKKSVTKAAVEKRPRAKVLNEHPGNLAVDEHDHVAVAALARASAKVVDAAHAPRKRTAVDRIDDPMPGEAPAGSLVERVSNAIERELSKIEIIIGGRAQIAPVQRIETESRARVLASLARTLKEIMRLREQERGADEERAKAADDDAVPRDLDEFRRELSRRLEGLVGRTTPLPAGGDEPC